jgi:serine/threonine-protein kinase HipA
VTAGRLFVNHEGRRVGVLERHQFAYASSWLNDPNRFALSQSLPLRAEPHTQIAQTWFGNLLPEGTARERIAQRFRIVVDDDFALLAALGRDCAGAITLDTTPDIERQPQWSTYRRLTADQLEQFARTPVAVTTVLDERSRLSLAGAQYKLSVRKEGSKLYLPTGGAASTHLLKCPNLDFAGLVENELLCLSLARRVGLSVVTAEPRLVEGGVLLVVERYDRDPPDAVSNPRPRTRAKETSLAHVRRRHQEDFVQALGRSRHAKYEQDGGPSLAECVDLVRRTAPRPAVELLALLRWAAFCFAIGNRDNHAKNLSRMLDPSLHWRLTPCYDLVCTTAYRHLSTRLAFAMGGEYRPDKVNRAHWEQEATQIGVAPRLMLREVAAMADAVATQLPEAFAQAATSLKTDARLVQVRRAIDKSLRLTRASLR